MGPALFADDFYLESDAQKKMDSNGSMYMEGRLCPENDCKGGHTEKSDGGCTICVNQTLRLLQALLHSEDPDAGMKYGENFYQVCLRDRYGKMRAEQQIQEKIVIAIEKQLHEIGICRRIRNKDAANIILEGYKIFLKRIEERIEKLDDANKISFLTRFTDFFDLSGSNLMKIHPVKEGLELRIEMEKSVMLGNVLEIFERHPVESRESKIMRSVKEYLGMIRNKAYSLFENV